MRTGQHVAEAVKDVEAASGELDDMDGVIVREGFELESFDGVAREVGVRIDASLNRNQPFAVPTAGALGFQLGILTMLALLRREGSE